MKFASLIVAIAFAGVVAQAADTATTATTTTTTAAPAVTETKTVEKKATHKKGGAKAHAEAPKATEAAPAAAAPAGH
jgi:hypothetical protein